MSEIIDPPAPSGASIQRLKPNAVGLVGVMFMAVATAAHASEPLSAPSATTWRA